MLEQKETGRKGCAVICRDLLKLHRKHTSLMCTVRERFSAYFMLKSLKCVLDIHLRTIMEKSPHLKSVYSYLEDKSIKIVFREVISTVGHTKAELMVFISDIRISEFDLSRLHGQRFSSKVKYLRRILDPKSN